MHTMLRHVHLILNNIVHRGIRRKNTEGGSTTRITNGNIGSRRGVGDGDTGCC